MSEFQTTVQDLTAILRGGGKLEGSSYQESPSYIDFGTLSGLEVEEVLEVNKEENDNADADELVTKQEVKIKANLHEAINSTVWSILRTGFDTETPTAGEAVPAGEQDFASDSTEAGGFYLLEGQNGKDEYGVIAKQTIATITSDPDGSPVVLVVDVDYTQVQGPDGRWGLVFIAGSDYDPTQKMTVVYAYTPTASLKVQSGNKMTLPWFIVRITTKNDGSPFYFTAYKCKIQTGKKISYPKDDDKDRRVKAPIEIICKPDPLYHPDDDGNGYVYETVQTSGI